MYFFFFFLAACMWSICQSSAKCYTGSDIRTLEGLHYETGFLIWFPRTESLVKRKELLLSVVGFFWGGERFYTNSRDELEGATWFFHWILIIVAVSGGKYHGLCCQITQFNLTRVIIVTLAGADGEMFVSCDYNYNHSVTPKQSGGAAFDWPPCWNHFTVLLCVSSKRYQPACNHTQVHKVELELKGSIAFPNSGGQPGENWRLAGALRADLYPGLSQAWGDDAHSSPKIDGGGNTGGKNELWSLKSSAWRETDISV